MPLYILYAKDKPDSLERRLEYYSAHRAFIEAQSEAGEVTVIMSGPLQTDDGEAMTGSIILLQAANREVVEHLAAADPFMRHGIWDKVKITRFHPRHSAKQLLSDFQH